MCKKIKRKILFTLIMILGINTCFAQEGTSTKESLTVTEDRQAKFFVTKCAGCHTIGKGSLTGPDLINAASLPLENLIQAVKRMQEKVGPMEESEIKGYASLIKSANAKQRVEKEFEKLSKVQEAKLESPDAKAGRDLFTGKTPFKNGGVSCISCHSTRETIGWGSGKLGPSLINILKSFSKVNLTSGIVNPQWKVMKDVYKEHPVTQQEAAHIVAFLESIGNLEIKKANPMFHIAGFIGFLIFACLTAFFYRKRLRSVRDRLRRM